MIQGLEEYTGVTIKVFNRWGNMVYESFEPLDLWDGSVNGKPLPVATYYYVISYVDENNKRQTITGPVTILR